MALKQSLANVAYAVPVVFALAAGTASAQAQLPVIEPSTTDLSKPIAAACVETTPGQQGLTAWDKLKTIMGARGQLIAASGNKIVQGKNERRELIFSVSNNFSGKEGYIINSAASKAEREQATGFCFRLAATSVSVDISKLDQVPSVLNQGELGVALTNNHNLGSKVAVMGMSSQGSLFAVHFNPLTHKAAYKGSNAQGGQARDLAILEDFDYSDKMKAVMGLANTKQSQERVAGLDARKLGLQ